MENKTIYTAVGHLRKKHDGPGRTYPVIIVNQREYMMDMYGGAAPQPHGECGLAPFL